MRTGYQRDKFIELFARESDNLAASDGIVCISACGAIFFADGIGTVQSIVQACPAGVDGIQHVSRIRQGNDQLRASLCGNFGIDIFRIDSDVGGNRHQISDIIQKCLVSGHILYRAWIQTMPVVQFFLQTFTLCQQSPVFRTHFMYDGIETAPKCITIDSRSGKCFFFNKTVKTIGYLQAVAFCTFTHITFLLS